MESRWLLPGAVLLGSVLIALAIASPTILTLHEDVGTRTRRDCESLVREGFPDSNQPERLTRVCVMNKGGFR
jgi:hypothetical protein